MNIPPSFHPDCYASPAPRSPDGPSRPRGPALPVPGAAQA